MTQVSTQFRRSQPQPASDDASHSSHLTQALNAPLLQSSSSDSSATGITNGPRFPKPPGYRSMPFRARVAVRLAGSQSRLIDMQRVMVWSIQSPPQEKKTRRKVHKMLLNFNALPKSPTNIDLDGMGLSSLPDVFDRLDSARALNVSGNRLTDLPALPPTLLSLNAAGNQLTECPLVPPDMKFLSLRDNPLQGVPPDILKQINETDNCVDIVRRWQNPGVGERQPAANPSVPVARRTIPNTPYLLD